MIRLNQSRLAIGLGGLRLPAVGGNSPASASVALLEDFSGSTVRKTIDGTQYIWAYDANQPLGTVIYSPGGQTQVGSLDTVNHRFAINVTGVGPGDSNGVYYQFFPRGDVNTYSYRNGFAQAYILSGTFDTNCNRLKFPVTCDTAIASNVPQDNIQVGNYVKSHDYSDATAQGQHYYYESCAPCVAGETMYFYLDRQVQAEVQGGSYDSNANVPYDVTFVTNADGYAPTPTHFFDALTRFYLDGSPFGGSSNLNTNWSFGSRYEFSTTNEATEPIASITGSGDGGIARLVKLVSTVCVVYDQTLNSGSGGYTVTWAGPKNISQSFKVAYKTSTMKDGSGWASGTWDGVTTNSAGSAYPGCRWNSPALARGTYFFGILPVQNNAGNFTEVSYP